MKKSFKHKLITVGSIFFAIMLTSCTSSCTSVTQNTGSDGQTGEQQTEQEPVQEEEETQVENENQTTQKTDDGIFETAQSALANIKIGWNLGNALDSYGEWIAAAAGGNITGWETAWGNPVITKDLIKAVKNAGFGAIRVPVTWRDHLDSDWTVDSKWLAHVKEVIDWVLAEDMYCIVNVHHDNGGDDKAWLLADRAQYEGGMSEKYAKLWRQIANQFKNYDEKLLFAGLNETLDASHNWNGSTSASYDVINDLNQLFVNTVRATGGNNAYRNLIVQTYGASSAASQVGGFKAPEDSAVNHLMAEVHIYDPGSFCGGTDVTWDKADEKTLDTIFERLNTKIVSSTTGQGLPLLVGEFGSHDKSTDEEAAAALEIERSKYAAYFVKKASSYGISCFWWDDGGEMSLFNRSKATVTQQAIIDSLLTGLTR